MFSQYYSDPSRQSSIERTIKWDRYQCACCVTFVFFREQNKHYFYYLEVHYLFSRAKSVTSVKVTILINKFWQIFHFAQMTLRIETEVKLVRAVHATTYVYLSVSVFYMYLLFTCSSNDFGKEYT